MKKPLSLAAAAAAILLLTSCGSSASEAQDNNTQTLPGTPVETSEAAAPVESLPFNASGLLFTNANPTFPDGEPGKVSVVQVGPIVDSGPTGTLLFAFRNNTADAIAHVDWTATARTDGSIVATGSSQGTAPSTVQSGEVGLAYIFFSDTSAITDGTEYEFQVDTTPADSSPFNTAAMTVTEANRIGDTIVGGAVNKTGEETSGPYSAVVYCFDGDNLIEYWGGYTEQEVIPVDGTGTFSVTLFNANCPTYAVGVSGWFS